MQPIRILFVTRSDGYGGAEKHLIELILRLDPAEVQPTLLCFGADPFSELLKQRNQMKIRIAPKLTPGGFLDFWLAFRKAKPETMLFVNGSLGLFPWYAYLAAWVSGARRVYALEHQPPKDPPDVTPRDHSWLNRLRSSVGWNARYLFRLRLTGWLCHRTICVSHAGREKLVRDYRYPDKRTVTIHNGADLQKFVRRTERSSVRESLGFAAEDSVVVSITRLSREKGIEVLLQAICAIAKEDPSCKCLIVGDGPQRVELETKSEDLGLRSRVFFVGFQEDVRPYLQAADVFVLPSYREGLPLALLEAMACGLACVATDVGGTAEAITHEHDGLLVRPGDADQLAQAVLRLLSNHEERQKVGDRGRQKVEQLFDVERSMEEIRKVLLD